MIVELLLANHPQDCLTCVRNQKCELQKLAKELGIQDVRFRGERQIFEEDSSSASIIRDPEKCILCKRCLRVCHELQSVGTLSASGRGWDTVIVPSLGKKMVEAVCVNCGQCINRCPTGALREKSAIDEVWAVPSRPHKRCSQTAPAVRAAIGGVRYAWEAVPVDGNWPPDAWFDKVLSTGLPPTLQEEGYELHPTGVKRRRAAQLTSCSPGWISSSSTS